MQGMLLSTCKILTSHTHTHTKLHFVVMFRRLHISLALSPPPFKYRHPVENLHRLAYVILKITLLIFGDAAGRRCSGRVAMETAAIKPPFGYLAEDRRRAVVNCDPATSLPSFFYTSHLETEGCIVYRKPNVDYIYTS